MAHSVTKENKIYQVFFSPHEKLSTSTLKHFCRTYCTKIKPGLPGWTLWAWTRAMLSMSTVNWCTNIYFLKQEISKTLSWTPVCYPPKVKFLGPEILVDVAKIRP